jgi:pyruvate dehydrogenase E2 component (dihydrolipoamide acetyltransferase)
MIKEIKLPEIADNVDSARVIDILVSVGDRIEKDTMVADMESDKAAFELPSEAEGIVKEVKVNKGDDVKVGQVLFLIETEDKADSKEKEAEDLIRKGKIKVNRKKPENQRNPGRRY